MKQKILILGGEGFIGNHLYASLNSAQFSVERSTRTIAGAKLSGDIDKALLDKCSKPDLIFHVAGGASVTESVKNPSEDFHKTQPHINALLNKMKTDWNRSKLIFVSSAAVYGSNASESTVVSTTRSPISPYGLHKKMAEDMICFYADMYGLPIKIVRPFSIFGPGLKKQLFWDALQKAQRGEFSYSGSGKQLRDWMYIEDLVSFLHTLALQNWENTPRVFNAGTGKATKVSDAIELILSLANYQQKPSFSQTENNGDPHDLVASESDLHQYFVTPKFSLEQGLTKYISWFNRVAK